MTANQIAFAAQNETERHNKAVEDETSRYQKKTNEINQYIAETDAWYKTESTKLTKQYNDAYTKSVEAEVQYKQSYLDQMAWIENQKAQLTRDYNSLMEGYYDTKNKEEKRHNQAQESIAQQSNTIRDMEVKLSNWNQAVATGVNYQIGYWNYSNNAQRIQNDYSIGLLNAWNTQQRNANDYQLGLLNWGTNYDLAVGQANRWKYQNAESIMTGIGNTLGGAGKAVGEILDVAVPGKKVAGKAVGKAKDLIQLYKEGVKHGKKK